MGGPGSIQKEQKATHQECTTTTSQQINKCYQLHHQAFVHTIFDAVRRINIVEY
jgi:hypothetical protein